MSTTHHTVSNKRKLSAAAAATPTVLLENVLAKKCNSQLSQSLPVPASLNLDKLLAWASEKGADVANLVFRGDDKDPFCSARSAYALHSIPPNSSIASIPACLILSETTARESRIGALLAAHIATPEVAAELTQGGRDPYAPGLILLAGYMAYERFVNLASFWKPYFDALPEEYSLPLWWDDASELLEGTNLGHTVAERRKLLVKGLEVIRDACGPLFPSHKLTWKTLRWAYSAISSRAFPRTRPSLPNERNLAAEEPAEISSGASELCLYPVLDMLNHRRGHRIEWQIREGVDVTFVALDGVEKGEEIYNNYGAKGNENLLGNYGFVLDPNPEDYVKIALNIRDASDRFAPAKRAVLARTTPNRLVHLLFEGNNETELPGDLMFVVRLLVMNGCEIDPKADF
ncbi:hypothetical protein HKX48_004724 [Thoreauomyces humboldtii]|nr:hypothetical protein HKX48_004724 [Thoreauomyces humboldtii]